MRGSAPIFIMLVLTASLHGATLTVDDDGPADYGDIQSAVQAAQKGDTILLADGVYRGPKNRRITFDGKALTLTSRNGPERCVMDCELKAPGFYLYGTGCVVEGITVINGWDARGAGIYCSDNASVTIRNCILRDNACWREGAGVYCSTRSNVTLIDCIICSNVSEDLGGGIRSRYANLTLDHCLIAYNQANSGGGLSCGGTSPQVIGCTFVQNAATTDGGGVQCVMVPLMLHQCVFIENQAGQAGGGLWLNGSEGKVVNCTLAANTAGTTGGGLFCSSGGSVQLINSILVNHAGHAVYTSWSKSAIIQGCLFHDNQPADVYSGSTAATGADRINALRTENHSNRTGDPHFGVPGDVRLTAASFCIDRGINELGVELPATDLDGNPRIIDATGNGTAVMDIGACEYNPQTPSIAISTEFVEFVREPNGPEPEPIRLIVGHGGGGPLNWRIDCNSPWLRIEPASGVAADASSEVTLSVDTANLARGIYQAIVEVRDPQAVNSPRRVLVVLKVQGVLAVPGLYSKIQDAIDATVEGETVEVGPGVYPESLVLRKSIHLSGIGGPVLTAPPSSPGIDIQISGCTVSGFEVHGGSTGIYVGSSDNMITDNKVQGSREGVLVNGSTNTLLNNEIADCSGSGLYLFTGGNTLRNNQMHGSRCNFRFSWVTRTLGRPVIDDIDTTNTVDGKAIYYLVGQSNVTIEPEANAGCVVAIDCRNIQVTGQTLQHNAYGVYFANTTDSQIADCFVTDNTEIGIFLQGSSRNRLTANTITGGNYGIQLYRAGGNTLRQNTVARCLYGFHCISDLSGAAHWRQDVTPDNTVDGKSIYYLVGANGTVIDSSTNAGCVYAVECSGITVRDLVIENNHAGVTFFLTNDSTIENVAAVNNEYAGIALYNSSSNVLRGNLASGSTYGILVQTDSLYIKNPKKNLIDRCTVSSNRTGIGTGPSTDIENCCVACNSEWGIQASNLRMANCTIFGNGGGAYEESWTGGLHLYYSTTPSTIVNSIFWANTRKQIMLEQTTADVAYCAIQGGYPGEGNLAGYPGLTPDGHLVRGSPCIGAGRGDGCPPHDLDGETRDPNGLVDIGCDQFVDADVDGLPDWWELAYFVDRTAAGPDEDPDEDGHDHLTEYELYSSDPLTPAAVFYVDADRPDDGNDGMSWATAKKSVQAAVDMACDSDVIRIAPGVYPGDVNPAGRAILLTGLDPENANTVAATVLTGTLTFIGGEPRGCAVAGLTISNPKGSGICCAGSCPTIRRCRITGNYYSRWMYGSGATLIGAAPLITHCNISGNRGYSKGSGIFSLMSSPVLQNCMIAGHTIGSEGVAVYAEESDVTIENCTLAHNGATPAWGSSQESAIRGLKSTMYVANSILWNNSAMQVLGSESSISVLYCDIKGGEAAMKGVSRTMGNIDVDPLFVAPGKWDSTPSSSNSTAQWIEGDYHLRSAGWRWDPSLETGANWVRDDVTSRCIDAGNPAVALGQEPITVPDDPAHEWGRNIRIDMGAYGGACEASIAPHDWAIPTDINNDGRADLRDFAYWATAFQSHEMLNPANATKDARVDYADLSRLAADWLDTTSWSR